MPPVPHMPPQLPLLGSGGELGQTHEVVGAPFPHTVPCMSFLTAAEVAAPGSGVWDRGGTEPSCLMGPA